MSLDESLVVSVPFQQLIEAEATAVIGAGLHERSESRATQRTGHRLKLVSTAARDVELGIPKLRRGSFFPSLWSGAGGSIGPCTRW